MLGLFFGTTFPPAISRNALQAEEAVVTGPFVWGFDHLLPTSLRPF